MSKENKIGLIHDFLKTYNPEIEQDPDMRETPKRFVKMYNYFFRNEDPKIHLEKKFPTNNDQIITVRNISAIGLCPHHLMPIEYKVHIGYLPDKLALGLSKFSRITKAVASKPILQENMTTEIADIIEKGLQTRGVMVIVQGIHGCMKFRGVEEKESETITSEIRGRFIEAPHVRQELLDLLKLKSI